MARGAAWVRWEAAAIHPDPLCAPPALRACFRFPKMLLRGEEPRERVRATRRRGRRMRLIR